MYSKGIDWTSLVIKWLVICRAMQGHGFYPWSRKITRAACELQLLKALGPELCSKRSHCNERLAHPN